LRWERPRLLEAALAPRPEDPELDPEQGDVVEHQRRDDLVDAEPRPEHARDQAPDRAGRSPSQHHRRDDDERRRPRREDWGEHDRARAPRPEQELALRADVPQAHPEGEGAGETREQERRRLDEGVRQDTDATKRGVEDVEVGADRVATYRGDDDPADDERDHDGGDGCQRRQPAGHDLARLETNRGEVKRHEAVAGSVAGSGAPPAPPVISSPISWT